MTFIYSFLQKRKMHENQHGIIMVVIAYALSVLLLVLGSDVFYNIKSTAAGTNTDTEEETQEINLQYTTDVLDEDYTSLLAGTRLMDPYSTTEIQEDKLSTSNPEDNSFNNDTVCFLGSAMDDNTFDTMMTQMSDYMTQANVAQDDYTELSDRAVQTDELEKATLTEPSDTIESFSVEVAASNTIITVSKEEVAMLERIVEAEAEGEDMVGKILVANVVFNRMTDEEFPDTVEDVIFHKVHDDYQFSPIDSGRYWSVDISEQTQEAVQRALDGEDYSKGALYFVARKRTTSQSAKWFDNNLDWLFEHGGHEFYK